ncbi:unnamed protein product [Lathyrus sativus]|nr:unnamed protein product [Lathyrus sativus]CAK8062466.1 unnamed protein product [Lathyrus sativus]
MNMASFVGNIGFKVSFHLLPGVSSIPRNIWKFRIACLKSRDFSSSSVTASYILITSCRVKIPRLEYCSFADGSTIKINDGKIGHTAVAHCETSQNSDKVLTGLLLHDIEESSEQLEEVRELTVPQIEDSREQDFVRLDNSINDVEQSAAKLLAFGALTAVELRKILLSKRFSPNAVEAVINKLQRQGFINDKLYAGSFSQYRMVFIYLGSETDQTSPVQEGS